MTIKLFSAWWLIENQPHAGFGKESDHFYKSRLTQVSCQMGESNYNPGGSDLKIILAATFFL